MKAFRIKYCEENNLNNTFKFILLSECSNIKINYSVESQESLITIQTIQTNNYRFIKTMNHHEFILFEAKFLRFQNSDEIFFNLGDFYLTVLLKD